MHFKVSKNNIKLGAIPNINTLACGKTCGNVPCAKYCYAKHGNYLYENVKKRLTENLLAYLENPKRTENEILLQLPIYGYVRWHSSGEIIDEDYLKMMVRIAKRLPKVNFLCFTKKYKIVNDYISKCKAQKKKAIPNNLTIVLSQWWEDYGLENPYNLPMSYVYNKAINNTVPTPTFECSGNCEKCLKCWHMQKGDTVVFNKH